MKMTIQKRSFVFKESFAITGYVFHEAKAVWVTLKKDGRSGRGEGLGCYYLGETDDSVANDLENVRSDVETGLSRNELQELLPPGGARNALDCAYWDLTAKTADKSVWELLNVAPRLLKTVYTIGLSSHEEMAAHARRASSMPILKIKLSGDDPVGRVEHVRHARPDADLIVDVNQGWSYEQLVEFAPALGKLGVKMIEQPLPRGADEELVAYKSPIPVGADESCLHLGEFDEVARRYDYINIKLDKCGGLTEALALVEAAKRSGVGLMVGNMLGSSLSMAPAHVVGQACEFVDLDGPLILQRDVEPALRYSADGSVSPAEPALWG